MDKLDQILKSGVVSSEETAVKNKLLAAGFVVVNKDGVVYSGQAGRLDFPASSAAYTLDTVSHIASMTKLATATAMLQLLERGLVGLDDDVRLQVPELGALKVLRGFDAADQPIIETVDRPITLRHLLTHTLGLGYDLPDPELMKWSRAVGRKATNLDWTLEGFTTPLKFAPGDGWNYGAAYDFAGLLLERLTKQKLGQYMQEHIFQPCGMERSTFWPETVDLVMAYAGDGWGGGDPSVLTPGTSPVPREHAMESGGAGLYSTPSDYAKFLTALLSGKLLKPETTDLMFTPQLNAVQLESFMAATDVAHDAYVPELPRGLKLDHGLAGVINIEDSPGKRRAGSLMWSGMTNPRWWIDRKTGIAAVMFTQLLPFSTPIATNLFNDLEGAVYHDLLPSLRNS